MRRILHNLMTSRAWLLFLSVAIGGFVWWLLLPRPPMPTRVFNSGSTIWAVMPAGKTAIGSHNLPAGLTSLDLATGKETEIRAPEHKTGHTLSAVTPNYFWQREFIESKDRVGASGAVTAFDRATLQPLATFNLRGNKYQEPVLHLGEKLVAVWREDWFRSCVRLQIFDPRTGRKESDRLLPMAADFLRVQYIMPSPDGRTLGLVFCHRPGPARPCAYNTIVLDLENGSTSQAIAGAYLNAGSWCTAGNDLVAETIRGPGQDLWAEHWDWSTHRKLGELYLGPWWRAGPQPVSRTVGGWLSATNEWLIIENRTPWTDRYPGVHQFLFAQLGININRRGSSSILAVNAETGAERLLADDLITHPRCYMLPNNEMLVQLLQVDNQFRYAIIPLVGGVPLAFSLRLALSALAGITVLVLSWRLRRKSLTQPFVNGV